MADPEKYGQFYWGVKVTQGISEDGEIYVHADEVQVLPNGAAVFVGSGHDAHPPQQNLILAPGSWLVIFAASIEEGSAIAVEKWKSKRIR